jgi:hypothetical protein
MVRVRDWCKSSFTSSQGLHKYSVSGVSMRGASGQEVIRISGGPGEFRVRWD